MGTLRENQCTFLIISRSVLRRMKNVSGLSFRENKKNTYFTFSNFFFLNSCRLWNNVEEFGRSGQATDDNMAYAHCMLGN